LAYIRKLRGILSKASLRFDMRASSMNEIAEELKFLVSEEYELNSTQAASLAKTLKAQQSFVEQSSTKLERRDKDRLAHMATSERSLIIIGDVDYVDEPIATFVRLSDPIPFLGGQSDAASADENRSTRFVFLLLGPPGSMSHLESKEMGRVMALALQNSHFHKATEIAGTRAQLLGNLDGFMEAQEVVTTDAQEGSSSEGCMASCFPKHRIEGGVLVGGLARGGFRTARTNIEAERFLYQREQRQKMSQIKLEIAEETGHDIDESEEGPSIIPINRRDIYLGIIVGILALGLAILLIAWHFHEPPDDQHESKLIKFNSHLLGYAFGTTHDTPYKFNLTGHNFNVMDVKFWTAAWKGNGEPQLTLKLMSVSSDHRRSNSSSSGECCSSCSPCRMLANVSMIPDKGDSTVEWFKTWDEDDYGTLDEHNYNYIEISTDAPSPAVVSGMMEVIQMGSLGNARIALGGVILFFVYGAILTEVLHRTLAAILGSFVALMLLTILTHPPSMKTIISYMDEGTLGLLFGMMIMVHLLSLTGLFEWAAVRAVSFSSKKEGQGGGDEVDDVVDVFTLTATLCIVTAVLSAFLDNVTTMLLLAPVTIEVCKVLSIQPAPILISEIMFSNIGGTSTMIGDPPNIIIGNMISEVTFTDFISNVMPPVIIMAPFSILLLRFIYGEKLQGSRTVNVAKLSKKYPITNQPLLLRTGIVFGTIILLLFMHPVHHKDAAWMAIVGAVFMLVISNPHELHHTLASVEWDTLLFFGGLFVMIEALAEMGLIRAIGDAVSDMIKSQSTDMQLTVALLLLLWVSAIVSGFLDNIPYTATMVPVIQILSAQVDLPIKPLAFALSLGACLGGNATLVGASANLVTAGIADHLASEVDKQATELQEKIDKGQYEKSAEEGNEEVVALRQEAQGMKISFGAFSVIGMPMTLLTVTISTGWCMIVYIAAGWTGTL